MLSSRFIYTIVIFGGHCSLLHGIFLHDLLEKHKAQKDEAQKDAAPPFTIMESVKKGNARLKTEMGVFFQKSSKKSEITACSGEKFAFLNICL